MKSYATNDIRNICLLSHGGVGKTTLAEAMMHTAGAIHKMGSVENGTSVLDTRADEKDRGMTISLKTGFCEWNNVKINILDTPGFLDLIGEARAALYVSEAACVLVDATDGVQVGTELSLNYVEQRGCPRLFFINGMNKDNADFSRALQSITDACGTAVAPVTIPIGSGRGFTGVIDLITKEAFEYTAGGTGRGKKIDIPADMNETVSTVRGRLMEAVAESDETLLNKYFDNGELSDDELRTGLAMGVREGLVYPVLVGCAVKNIGVDQLLFKISNLCPGPDIRTEIEVKAGDADEKTGCTASDKPGLFVFKTLSEEHIGEINIFRVFGGTVSTGMELKNPLRSGTEKLGGIFHLRGRERIDAAGIVAGDIGGVMKLKNTHTNDSLVDKSSPFHYRGIDFPEPVVRVAISAKVKGEEEKISTGLAKLNEEDAQFTYRYHADIRQSVLSAMGDIHLDIILSNLKNRFKVEVDRTPTKISYRETVTKPVKYVEYTHKKQTGGAGQYARVFIDLEPAQRGEGYEFVDKIVGGVIDQPFRPSVDKGIRAKMTEGILAGYPIVDVKVALVDGKTHPVDSKDVAFQIAGREVFKKAFDMAGPILLEPIMDLKVIVPEEYMGDVMGDISSRRGKIQGMNPQGKYQEVVVKVPEAEVQNYSQALRSLTQGRGFFSKSFSHYDPVPSDVARKVVEQTTRETAGANA